MTVSARRIYLPRSDEDGYRVLVDRLWPRGMTKAAAGIDLWLRDIAPSTELRRWYGHVVERWPEFQERYRTELAQNAGLVDRLADLEREHGRLTLLFGARDEVHNEAQVIVEVLRQRASPDHGTD